MKITRSELINLQSTLKDVADAIVQGRKVWQRCPVEGWVGTTAMYAHTPVEDFHIGDVPPKEE